ncbi:histidine phosphatase family protein, partial [Streptomyces sp. NPDC057674]
RGLTLAEVAALEPAAFDAWLTDARTAPHGGEPLLAFITRIGNWLDTRPAEDGEIVAVAEPSVVRAALVYALKAPPATYWNVDVRPLSTVTLTGRPGLWHLQLDTALR